MFYLLNFLNAKLLFSVIYVKCATKDYYLCNLKLELNVPCLGMLNIHFPKCTLDGATNPIRCNAMAFAM